MNNLKKINIIFLNTYVIKKLFLVLLFIGVSSFAAPLEKWVVMAGTSLEDKATGVATDSNGNVYISGYTRGDLDGEFNANLGGADAFLSKYDGSGVRQWTKLLGSASSDYAYGVAVDSNDYIYITGHTAGDLSGETNAGGFDIFLAKYSSFGVRQWTRLIGTDSHENGWGIAIDNNDDIYLSAKSKGDLSGETCAGGYDIAVIKYNSDGIHQWTRLAGSAYNETVGGIAIDSSGSICITGSAYYSIDGMYLKGGNDMVYLRYSSSGTKEITRLLGASSDDYGRGLATAAGGDLFFAGDSSSSSFYDGSNVGEDDVAIIKYKRSGFQWGKSIGSNVSDVGREVVADDYGSVYFVGESNGSIDSQLNSGLKDICVIKTNLDGEMQWVRYIGSDADDYASDITVDGNGNIYAVGYAYGDIGEQTNAGDYDIVIVKYRDLPDIQTEVDTNPNILNIDYTPDGDVMGTLSFEDKYPVKGDYDFNDLVLGYKYRHILDLDNKVKAVSYLYTIRAMGARNALGFAIQFQGVTENVAYTATLAKNNGAVISTIAESGKAWLTFNIFDNAKTELACGNKFVNTAADGEEGEGDMVVTNLPTYELIVTFDVAINSTDIAVPNNPYIYYTITPNVEVHLPEKTHSGGASTLSGFGSHYEGVSQDYLTLDGFPWAKDVQDTWDFPKEKVGLEFAYPEVVTWAASGGVSATNWYADETAGYLQFRSQRKSDQLLYIRNSMNSLLFRNKYNLLQL